MNLVNIIILILAIDFIIEKGLLLLNIKASKNEIPSGFEDYYDKEKFQKNIAYRKENRQLSIISSTIQFLLIVVAWKMGWFEWWSTKTAVWISHEFWHGVLFFVGIFTVSSLISLPFGWYSTFVIEEKYGFNKTTYRTYILDAIKGMVMSAIIGLPIYAALFFAFDIFGAQIWWIMWCILGVFVLFFATFYTSLIVPVFNKLSPLEEGSLRDRIEQYAKEADFQLKNIFVIDGSKRSTKANAYFSGLGGKKAIVLFDTLIEKHTEEELVAVLAHEVGHYKKKHILGSMIISVLQIGVMSFLFYLLLYYLGNGHLENVAFHWALLVFSFLYAPVSFLTGILGNVLSRKNEFEADAFAAKTYDAKALSSALKRLSAESYSNFYPHPWYVFVHYSHPPVLQRLEKLQETSA